MKHHRRRRSDPVRAAQAQLFADLRRCFPGQGRELKEIVAHVTEFDCLLCGGEKAYVGVLFPALSPTWGGGEPKEGAFYYALCSKCFEKPGRAQQVEERIKRAVEAQRAILN